jgi:ornithine cyclodeaminase/alanine dehydrogenase-like protein (mu-crystallin family)
MTLGKTIVLTVDDTAAIVGAVGLDRLMDELIERLDATLTSFDRDVTVALDRAGFHYTKPELGLVEWMPTMTIGKDVTIKMVGYHPGNPVQRRIPSVLSTTSRWDTTSGHLVALSESTFLTALRTGAASAVATDVLAVDRPIVLGLIGAGAQAVTQAHAISRVRSITEIVVCDVDTDIAGSLSRRLDHLDTPIRVIDADHVDDLVGRSDVLCTATSVDIGAGPVFAEAATQPWLHVNAVGADFAGKFELPKSLLDQSFVVPDNRTQCIVEGECQMLAPEAIGPSLPELLADRHSHEHRRDERTVFDSTGWAVEDQVVLDLLLDHARDLGIGHALELEAAAADPYDPYAFLDERSNPHA